MQNSYIKEGQLSWCPFKIENYFNFYPGPASPARKPGPRAGSRALDISRARPGPLTNQRAQWPAPGWARPGCRPLCRSEKNFVFS